MANKTGIDDLTRRARRERREAAKFQAANNGLKAATHLRAAARLEARAAELKAAR